MPDDPTDAHFAGQGNALTALDSRRSLWSFRDGFGSLLAVWSRQSRPKQD